MAGKKATVDFTLDLIQQMYDDYQKQFDGECEEEIYYTDTRKYINEYYGEVYESTTGAKMYVD